MKKQSILCLISFMLIILCSCSNNEQSAFKDEGNVSYKEAERIDYKALYNTSAVLMFKADSNDSQIGELYIKPYGKDEEKIADNVNSGQYMLLNGNDVVYIDTDNSLYLKKYGQKSVKTAENVPYESVYVSAKNAIYYRTYEDNDFLGNYDANYKEILLDSKGNTNLLFDSAARYNSGYTYKCFTENGKFLYFLNEFNTLCRLAEEEKIEKIAGNVYGFDVTSDGSAFVYNNYKDRLYIKWSGAQKAAAVKNLDVYSYYQLSNNGLSCVFLAYDDNGGSDLMFVTPFNEPVSIIKNITGYLSSSNNEYIYALDENNKLYGFKLPKITAQTNSENLIKQLNELEKIVIDTDVNYYAISQDGKSVSYINSKKELYTSYELAEAVKVQENIKCIDYIYDAIVFMDENSKLYVNDSFADMSKVAGLNQEICDNLENFYVENSSLYHFVYVDKESNIYTYSTNEKSKLIVDNAKEYSLISNRYANLYVTSLSIEDVVGIYSFENASNSYDSGVIEITKDTITIVPYDHVTKKGISVIDSTPEYVTLIDDEGNDYIVYKYDTELKLEIYDAEANSYYQYNLENTTDDDFKEKLDTAQSEMKYNAVYALLEDYYYSDGYEATEALPLYDDYSLDSEIIGYIVSGDTYYVRSYYVEDDYNFWLQIEYYASENNYNNAWIYIDTSDININ